MSNDLLSEDLLVEIFSRLPPKSLLRFRSLSKSLHACISNPRFIRLHTLRSPKRFTIIHRSRRIGLPCSQPIYTSHPETKLSYNPYIRITPREYPFKSFRIVGSCDGILCVYEYGTGVNLWNPSIRRKVTVPDHLPSSRDRFVLGFGSDPVMDDYKIVRTSGTRSFIYTLKTCDWREIASPSTSFFEVKSCQCLFNGALHWVVKWYLTDALDVSHCNIMRFDLSSEVFSTIELPEPCWKSDKVTVIKGCLAVISSRGNRSKRHGGRTRIWVMREYNNVASWFVAFELNRNPFRGAKKVFQRATNGDLVFNNDNMIQAYDPDKRVLSKLRILRRCALIADVNMCVESLGLLDMGTSIM